MGGGFRVLHLVRPFLSFLPEVLTADMRVPFMEKVRYTVISLFIFLVCIQLPLCGIHSTMGADPSYWMCHSFIKSWGCYCGWHHSSCYLWTSDATLGRIKNHWNGQQCLRRSCTIVSIFILIVGLLPLYVTMFLFSMFNIYIFSIR